MFFGEIWWDNLLSLKMKVSLSNFIKNFNHLLLKIGNSQARFDDKLKNTILYAITYLESLDLGEVIHHLDLDNPVAPSISLLNYKLNCFDISRCWLCTEPRSTTAQQFMQALVRSLGTNSYPDYIHRSCNSNSYHIKSHGWLKHILYLCWEPGCQNIYLDHVICCLFFPTNSSVLFIKISSLMRTKAS